MKNRFILIFIFSIIFPIFLVNKAEAISLDKPFGGKSILVTICTCDGTFMISMLNLANNFAPEMFIYSPFSTALYANFLFMKSDTWMIGTAEPYTVSCMEASPSGCTPIGVGYPIRQLGTSL